MSLSEKAQDPTIQISALRSSNLRESLTDQAYRRLEELIVTLKLAPGEVLSEANLAQTLDIGRTPIREALQRLAMEGLVVILARRGVLVSDIDVRKQLDMFQVRREVERLMARLAAARATPAERAGFESIADGMDASATNNDDTEFMRLDKELNQLLAQSCRNEYARKTMGLMQGLSRRFWYQHYKEALDLPRCATLHAQQARAVSKGNPDKAGAATDRLIDYMVKFTKATLSLANFAES